VVARSWLGLWGEMLVDPAQVATIDPEVLGSAVVHEPRGALAGVTRAPAPAVDRMRHAQMRAHETAACGSLSPRHALVGVAADRRHAVVVLGARRCASRRLGSLHRRDWRRRSQRDRTRRLRRGGRATHETEEHHEPRAPAQLGDAWPQAGPKARAE